MATTIAWVDHDEQAQRAARSILDDFAEKSAVDELGLGVVRDAIAEALYPGVSTLHRRPRYLLFIAWTYRDLMSSGVVGAAAVERGRVNEHKVRRALETYYGDRGAQAGIIGKRAGEGLKRLPSAVYWAALRRYGVRCEGASGSVDAYCHLLGGRPGGRRESLLRGGDDAAEAAAQLWAELPDPDPGRHSEVSFDLTVPEALFLRERLVRSEAPLRAPDEQSLLAWFAGLESWSEEVDPSTFLDDPGLPSRTREVLEWSRLFDLSVHGARLLYNLMCAQRLERTDLATKYRAELENWSDEVLAAGLPAAWRADDFWRWITRWRSSGTRRVQSFHSAWMRMIEDADLRVADHAGARALVADREVALKRTLARLHPGASRRLDQFEGDAGIRRYDYNWSIARRVLDDLHASLGHTATTTEV